MAFIAAEDDLEHLFTPNQCSERTAGSRTDAIASSEARKARTLRRMETYRGGIALVSGARYLACWETPKPARPTKDGDRINAPVLVGAARSDCPRTRARPL